MADNVTVSNAPLSDYPVATDDDGTAQHQYVKLEFGADGVFTKVDGSNPLPVAGPLTDTQLRATAVPVSLATVYNTLHQFTDVGLLRQVAVDGSKTYFDTNASEHHHFFVEGDNELVDIPGADVIVDKMPIAPAFEPWLLTKRHPETCRLWAAVV